MSTTTKYKGIWIETTPTDKYPQLVTFTKTVKKLKDYEGKKFLTYEHAIKFIDSLELHLWERQTQLRLETQEKRRANREMMKLNGLQLIRVGGDEYGIRRWSGGKA